MAKKYIYAQTPNLPILVWFVSFLLLLLLDLVQVTLPLKINYLLELISFGAIFTWAWLEIFDGVNNFRRILGLIVMVVILVVRIV